jgi:uncharacterized protein YjbI with pentapeptide repeats
MANREHLAKLREGPEAWNQWREEQEDVVPDLSGADLNWADLSGADLSGADLIEADLSAADLSGAHLSRAHLSHMHLFGADFGGANLSGAHLIQTDLFGAKLTRAHLSSANLYGADLNLANLSEANLREANLSRAHLSGANLSAADLTRATLAETVLGNANLSEAKGLDTCIHGGPSTIDHRTIARSGLLPLAFLQGCGLSDWQIEATKLNLENLSNHRVDDILNRIAALRYGQPIQFHSCFISYSTKDHEFAERLHADLQNNGVRCWFAPHQIQGGKKLHEQIVDAIRRFDRLLLLLSEDSMESKWVETEIANARAREEREKRRVLFPLRLVDFETLRNWQCFDADTGTDSAREIREYFIPDFSKWKDHDSYQKAFDRLLKDLKAEAGRVDSATGRTD